jgi:hypothetical protein
MPCTAIREKATSKDDSRNHLTPGRFLNSLIRRSLCKGDMDMPTTPAKLFGSSTIRRQFYHSYHDNIPGSDSACHDIFIRQHMLLDENSIITTANQESLLPLPGSQLTNKDALLEDHSNLPLEDHSDLGRALWRNHSSKACVKQRRT